MSYKIPKVIEDLGAEILTDVDMIENGDFVIVPPISDAPKLHVSVPTMRSWGLSVSSYAGPERNNYGAARRTFGKYAGDQFGAKYFVARSVSHDMNANFCGDTHETEFVVTNPNDVNGSKIVRKPKVFPLMNATLEPFRPMFPLENYNFGPRTCSLTGDKEAYDLLMSKIGPESLLTSSLAPCSLGQEGCDLPATIAVISTIVTSRWKDSVSRSNVKRHTIDYNYSPYTGKIEAANAVMCDLIPKSAMTGYFPYQYPSDRLAVGKKFMLNIVKRGAIVMRCPKLLTAASSIMAGAVARRYGDNLATSMKIIDDMVEKLKDEREKLCKIIDTFRASENALSLDEKLMKFLRINK